MPTLRKSSRIPKTSAPHSDSIEHLEEQAEIEERLLRPGEWEREWEQVCKENELNIFERCEAIPSAHRNECHGYLYRLEPRVYNAPGEGSNIEKFYDPLITLEVVKQKHGGGKYKFILKRGRRTLGSWNFAIDGEPILKNTQVDASGKAVGNAPGEPQQQRSEVAEAIRAITQLLQPQAGPQKAMEASIAVMAEANKASLKLQSDAAAAAIASPTGNKLLDTLLPAIVERLLTPAPVVDPLAAFEKVVKVLESLKPPPPVAPNPGISMDPMEQLGFVKDLLGVDSIKDLITKPGGAKSADPWFAIAAQLVGAFPAILAQFGQMQEMNFRRQLVLAQVQHGGAQPASGDVASTPATRQPVGMGSRGPSFPTFPTMPSMPAIPPVATTQEQLIEKLIGEISRYFQAGYDGTICAANLKMNLPEAVVMLQTVLSDRGQLGALIQNVPALAQLSTHPTWNEFLEEFVEEMQAGEERDEGAENNDGKTAPVN